jgi:serine/threonine protein kinase
MSNYFKKDFTKPLEIEITPIKKHDGIPYIPFEQFEVKFSRDKGKLLGKGSFGEVYASGRHAVKVFNPDSQLRDLILELDAYASNIHPCILMPVAWSVENEMDIAVGYLAMERGEDIITAYSGYKKGKKVEKSKISIEQIILDSLSAIAFLNSKGIAHRDIKPGNMVYHEGRCKIIDMGGAKKCDLNIDGEYYVKGVSGTPDYIDPEYYDKQYSSIKLEIYSLAASYVHIVTGNIFFGSLYTYTPTDNRIDWFVEQANLFWVDRPNIHTLLQQAEAKYGKNADIGISFEEPPMIPTCDRKSDFDQLTKWVLFIAYKDNYNTEALFLALHLIHRTYKSIMSKIKNTMRNIKLYGSVILYLALVVVTRSHKYDLYYWRAFDNREGYTLSFETMLTRVLASAKGIITTLTYWDYAASSADLLPLLSDIVQCSYNPKLVRHNMGSVSNKCINTQDFMNSADLSQMNINELGTEDLTIVRGCVLDVRSNIAEVDAVLRPRFAKYKKYNDIDVIMVLFRNRDVLDQLSLYLAVNIFSYYRTKVVDDLINFLLDTICSFDWRNHNLLDGEHPFRLTQEEIILSPSEGEEETASDSSSPL